jgi:hypothetical protein
MIKSGRLGLEGHVVCILAMRNVYKTFIGKPAGKRPLGSPRHSWEDNIKIYLRETGWEGEG